jgi:hypothetical protein
MMKRFFASGGAVVMAAALFVLVGCSNPDGGGSGTPVLVSISVETTKSVYLQGEDLSLDTIRVTGTYSDAGTQPLVISAGNITGYHKNEARSQLLTVTVEGKSATFTVTVTADPNTAKATLSAALDEALDKIAAIAVSGDGSDVPQGVKWVTPEQKAALDEAVETARELVAADDVVVEDIVAALEALQTASEELLALAEEQTGTATPVNALSPVISAQPQDAAYTVGQTATALSVTAASPDGGVLSYQWHSASSDGDWTAISGATGPGYTPPTDTAGALSYYALITNTRNDVSGAKTASTSSNPATVTVTPTEVINAQAPVISAQPQDAAYTVGQTATALSVTATVSDGGVLSYQWHSATPGGDWAEISGATGSSHTPSTAAEGAISYYVRITNTNNTASGAKTGWTSSGMATITVTLTEVINAETPVINTQPQNASYTVGQTAAALSVTASASDGGVLSFQWHRRTDSNAEWTEISGATGPGYTPSTAAEGAVSYYARVTNTKNDVNGAKTASASSNPATVTVTVVNAEAPVISVQPQSAAYKLGDTATALSVTATVGDGGTLSYQWHSDSGGWKAIPGATGASHTPSTAAGGVVSYYVRVTSVNNAASGTKTATKDSDTATVAVTVDAQEPVISVQPQNADYAVDGAATALSVTAAVSDGGVLSYQWHEYGSGWTAITNETGSSYTPPTGAAGTFRYLVKITNTNNAASGTKTAVKDSDVATVTVRVNAQAPLISAQPQDAAYKLGDAATALSVTAAVSDGGILSYQWHSSADNGATWTPIGSVTEASYTPPVNAEGTLSYYVKVANTNNSVDGVKTAATDSRVAKVTVSLVDAEAPVISVQPQSAAYLMGQTATALSVTAAVSDGGILTRRWYSSTDNGLTWTSINNATGSSYLPPTNVEGTVSYYVKITNTNNSASGEKTATTDSDTVAVVITVNAQAPVITAHPQSASYTVVQTAAPLSVSASSPDGGVLSYQWHSSADGGSTWTAIGGATGSSYTPPTNAEGTIAYYVKVINTKAVSGINTATINSNTATITTSLVNALSPVIYAQPLSASYTVGQTAAALFVTADSPDGGVLSYQWHISSDNGSNWSLIGSATDASYIPQAATVGTFRYYVEVVNTNNSAGGIKTASLNSDIATVAVAKASEFSYSLWVNEDDSLISNAPPSLSISKTAQESLAFEAADGLTGLQWSLDSVDINVPRGTAKSIVIEAVNCAVKEYTLGLFAMKGGVPYSINIVFTVNN